MKIALHVSERMFQKWPQEYCDELTAKLLDKGHRVFRVSEEYPQEANQRVIDGCDLLIGTPSEWTEYAKGKGIRTLLLLGPTLQDEGVRSPIVCAGCLDKMEVMDCFFNDENCMLEITPNDVLEAI